MCSNIEGATNQHFLNAKKMHVCAHTQTHTDTYLLIQLCLLLNSSLCSQQKQRGLDPRANMWKGEDEIVAACSLQVGQVAVASWQQVAGGTDWDWELGLAAGCLVSCLSRCCCCCSHVACLLGSQGKRKTFACLPLARAAGDDRGRKGGGAE